MNKAKIGHWFKWGAGALVVSTISFHLIRAALTTPAPMGYVWIGVLALFWAIVGEMMDDEC